MVSLSSAQAPDAHAPTSTPCPGCLAFSACPALSLPHLPSLEEASLLPLPQVFSNPVPPARYLLEQREVEVNVRDKWDSTPL